MAAAFGQPEPRGVDGDKRAICRVRGRVEIGDLAFAVELPIVETTSMSRSTCGGSGSSTIMTPQSHGPAARGQRQNQRMYQKSRCRRDKAVIERTAGRHRLLRQAAGAIHGVDDPHAVPVEACWLIELVEKPNFDFLAFLVTQERSRHFAL